MNNVLFGVQNVGHNISFTLTSLLNSRMVWGFALGFLISTIVHVLVITERPRTIPTMITRSLEESYKQLNPGDTSHPEHRSIHIFGHEYRRVRRGVLLMGVAVAIVIGVFFYNFF
ncbi:hypothetical protein CO046_02875 [Candidatus Peregrinibacteria bacterium CG_4_9_14_0_2_um_filter_53_11]|nr:MAG: hypothetical protein CO046_02875 [Candidatus Peregrinibacteria bacterium CG_4_9_14_0_2_um_filter_53_11]